MTDPFQFLIAAIFYHPAAPFLAVFFSFGLLSICFIAFDTRVHRSTPGYVAQKQVSRAAPAPPMPAPAEQLASAAIDRVPVFDPARAILLERLEDVVECLGRAQRVLPDTLLSRALRVCAEPGTAEGTDATQLALDRVELDFGVFSYSGKLDFAVMIGPQAGASAKPFQHLIDIALKKADVPLIRVPVDASPAMLRARIPSALLPSHGPEKAA